MGYRSEVAIACAFPTDQQAVGYITKQRMLLPKKIGDDDYNMDVWKEMLVDNLTVYQYQKSFPTQPKCTIIYSIFEGIKWYENYKDVQAIQKFYKEAEESGGAWIEVRVGEDHACDDESGFDQRTKEAEYCHDCLTESFSTTASLYTPDSFGGVIQGFNNFIKEAKHNEEVK